MGTITRAGRNCEKHGYYWFLANTDATCPKCGGVEAANGYDLGEIRPDLDTLLAADSVCLRTLSDLPQSGNL